jgi:D-beta-D-heptose 7-phosphate kinase/D-beta-D-heptose 1-phosphate adenosyltransferase
MRGPLVVIGDSLLDIDLEGVAERLAPDSPVPVLHDLAERPRPGGAALAATMVGLSGTETVLVTGLGDDAAGEQLEELLRNVRVLRVPCDGPTPVKQRVRANGQSLLRLDRGTRIGRLGDVPDEVAAVLRDASGVLVSDYGRGLTATPAVRTLLASLSPRVPVVWDPHPQGSEPVAHTRLATPNRSEASLFAARYSSGAAARTALAEAGRNAATLVDRWRAQAVAVTLGEEGALLSYGTGAPVVVPAPKVSCVDPCGAGDRFAASAVVGLAEGQVTVEAVHQAVSDAAAYVAAGGPASLAAGARPTPAADTSPAADQLIADVSRDGGTTVATGGCFDLLHAGHVATLRAARQLGDCLVVCLNSDDSVRRLKGPSRPLVPAIDRARVLEALEFVDAVVVFDEDTPADILRRLKPDIWVLPYLQGRSTTQLVRTATERTVATPLSDDAEILR